LAADKAHVQFIGADGQDACHFRKHKSSTIEPLPKDTAQFDRFRLASEPAPEI
jgi:hypothetical protein